MDIVGDPDGGVFVDAFAGTGAVARAAALRGWSVKVNDHLYAASLLAAANVASDSKDWFAPFGGYGSAVNTLAQALPRQGFIWREYSPASVTHAGVERMYFTEANAAAIDGVRARISDWASSGLIEPAEERILLADLLNATSRVANTAGTFGCFLRKWMPNATRPLALVPRRLLGGQRTVEVFNGDASDVPCAPGDVAYFDPPYTKRQYAAYYHVLETVARGDAPKVEGVTGLRPWREGASDFCYQRKALGAIVSLVARAPADRVFLSYSSEGHVAMRDLRDALSCDRDVKVHALAEIDRYAPNEGARERADGVVEYLFEITRP